MSAPDDESGVGKSALLNALAGNEVAGTGDVRDGDHKGRHTTTARQLHIRRGHCRVIDTPGLREKLRREAASAELRADRYAHHQAERRFGRMVRQALRDRNP